MNNDNNHNHHDKNHDHESHQKHNHGGGHHNHHKMMVEDFKKRFWVSLALSIPVVLLSPTIQGFLGITGVIDFSGSNYVSLALSTIVYLWGGLPFLKGLYDEMKKFKPSMMTLIGLAISVAYLFSTAVVFGFPGKIFFWELVTLIDIMLLGHWIEMKSVMGASKALEKMAQLLPSSAHKIEENGETSEVKATELQKGDKVLVKPGETIPADGFIYDGSTEINQSMITGESTPVEKKNNDKVIGGSVNGDFAVKVEISGSGNESYLSKVMDIVSKAQEDKSRTRSLADKAAFWLTIAAISSGVITFIAWYFFVGYELNYALTRAVTVMIITCPHALGLAIPLVVAVSTDLTAKNGLLIRNRSAFEVIRNVNAVVFDKTGTLTEGKFKVERTFSFNEQSEDELLKLAASVEAQSEHPIASGIVDAVEQTYQVESFEALRGEGVKAKVEGNEVLVVSNKYLDKNNIKVPANKELEEAIASGENCVFIIYQDELAGAITLRDRVRKSTIETIKKLNDMGIHTFMLTGDSEATAKRVGKEINIKDVYAEVKPEEKSDKVKEIKKNFGLTVMVGDGVNDAPALATADVGIAIGAGTDVAVETADIVLVKNEPSHIGTLIGFSKKTYSKMIQNLFWATGYNLIAIPLAAGVLYSVGIILSPAVGAVLMSLSTVIVAINAKMLKLTNS